MTRSPLPPALSQAASLLLAYPGSDWPCRLELVRDCLARVREPGEGPARLLRFCAAVADVPQLELAARYVVTFDRSRRRTLHLTYYTDGDTRRRGASLVALKRLYRTHHWEPAEDELPDHLPLVLEFAARCPEPGTAVLRDHRAGLELLRMALEEHGGPYADVVGAVCRALPGPVPADRAAARRLARTGPPTETVGLAPFGTQVPHLP